jgi:mannose-1-phosphate guanylyltransferase/mannose-6-phosphate isomerase
MINTVIVILCGGYGKRLWPLSSKHIPKQFIKIENNQSLFQQTISRSIQINQKFEFLILANKEHRFLLKEQINELKINIQYQIILEPSSKNTGPSTLLAALHSSQINHQNLLIFSADHYIKNETKFLNIMKKAVSKNIELNELLLFGIKPEFASTEYGYLSVNKISSSEKIKLEQFVEKPSHKKAKKLITDPNIFWNSGIFYINSNTLINAYKKYSLKNFNFINKSWLKRSHDLDFIRLSEKDFNKADNISIDYAVIEKFKKLNLDISIFPLNVGWSDLGSYAKLKESLKSDRENNSFFGSIRSFDSTNNFVISPSKPIFLAGVSDLVVINTPDNILVADINKPESLLTLYQKLVKDNPKFVENHYEELRPWGSFIVIAEGVNYKVKKIIINPLSKLSYQSHNLRNEHWVVVSGKAHVRVNRKVYQINQDESMYIKKKQKHQLINNSKSKILEIVEVQTGDTVEESDIIRYEDEYGRI